MRISDSSAERLASIRVEIREALKKGMALSVVSQAQGSWRWQPRFGINSYRRGTRKDGSPCWELCEWITTKVTPNMATILSMEFPEIHGGRLHKVLIEDAPKNRGSRKSVHS